MGGTRSSGVDWGSYTSTARASVSSGAASFGTMYTNKSGVKDEYHPKNIKVRESRASVANPHPTPVILALDCTGSMQNLAVSALAGMGALMAETYDKMPVSDPHIMAMFFDDVITSPNDALQATQFEADKVILDQIKDLYFVGLGGGNASESSGLPLYFAINKTDCDAFKEGRKGFIFLVGDDGPPPALTRAQLVNIFGPDFDPGEEQSFETLLAQAEENWHVFNIIPTRGSNHYDDKIARWKKYLGERVIPLEDISKLSEVCVATMQVIAGADAATVAASFSDPGTSLVVASAIKDLIPSGHGVVRL